MIITDSLVWVSALLWPGNITCLETWQKNRINFTINIITEIVLARLAPFATFYMFGGEDKRTNNRTMLPALKNNAAVGYQGPVKIELLKGVGLLTVLKSVFIVNQCHTNVVF